MAGLRILNTFYAAMFVVMALVSIAFLTASMSDRDRAPTNVWISIGWTALFLLYAGLAFANLRKCGADGPHGRLIALNAAAAAPMLAGLFAGDPAARFLSGVAAVPFALTAALLFARRRGNPA